MIIECPACSSRYRIREDKLPDTGGNIKCPNCAHIFFVPRDGSLRSGAYASAPAGEIGADSGAGFPTKKGPPVVEEADGERKWKLRNPVGLIYDFPTTDQLRGWLASRDSFEGLEASHDGGASWLEIDHIAELADLRPTGRKPLVGATGPLTNTPRTSPQLSVTTKSVPSGSFPASAEQIREEAEARLKEARASREVSTSSSVIPEFRHIKPARTRESEQTSMVLLMLALLVLPAIAAVGLHTVGVIDLSNYGILGERSTPTQISVTPNQVEPQIQRPRHVELTTDEAVTLLMSQASSALARDEPLVAIEYLEEAADIDPDATEVWCPLVSLYEDAGRMNDFERAREQCEGEAEEEGPGGASPDVDAVPIEGADDPPEQP